MSDKRRYLAAVTFAGLAYFTSYPEDVQAIVTPVATFLNLTTAISPWLYGVVAMGIFASAMVKTWGGRQGT